MTPVQRMLEQGRETSPLNGLAPVKGVVWRCHDLRLNLADLFNAFSGSCLDVSLETDQVLRESYSQLDLDVIYRDVNAYLFGR